MQDTIVNQLLTKIDGVSALNNVLIIGITNRRELLDSALLRPGRLEVDIEVGLPDERGRAQILDIHTRGMRESDFLGDDVDLGAVAARTQNFGAELEGVRRSAASFALDRMLNPDRSDTVTHGVHGAGLGLPDEAEIAVSAADFDRALAEVTPHHGAQTSQLEARARWECRRAAPPSRGSGGGGGIHRAGAGRSPRACLLLEGERRREERARRHARRGQQLPAGAGGHGGLARGRCRPLRRRSRHRTRRARTAGRLQKSVIAGRPGTPRSGRRWARVQQRGAAGIARQAGGALGQRRRRAQVVIATTSSGGDAAGAGGRVRRHVSVPPRDTADILEVMHQMRVFNASDAREAAAAPGGAVPIKRLLQLLAHWHTAAPQPR